MVAHLWTRLKRHPLIAFFALTYAITWCPLAFGSFWAFGPLVAALIVLPITGGWTRLRELGSRMVRWRVRWYWYALAVALPLLVLALTVTLNVALGAPAPSLAQLDPWYAVVVVFVARLINPLDGPLGEEPGWRGVALPGLQATRSPLFSTLVLAALVAGWHLPLLLPQFGGSAFDLLGTAAVTFWYTWLFNHTNGSVLITLIAHSAEGIVQYGALWPGGAAAARMGPLYALAWCAFAVALVVLDWKAWRIPAPVRTTAPEAVPRTA
jgi:membrane protease YdiL (CAAX protease family)